MEKLEIIHVRSSILNAKDLARQIRDSLGHEPGYAKVVTLYRRDGFDTDLAIHIVHLNRTGNPVPSDLGVRLVAVLQTHGLVEHTVWEQLS